MASRTSRAWNSVLRGVPALACALGAEDASAGELFRIEGRMISPVIYEVTPPLKAQVNAGLAEVVIPVQAGEKTWVVPGASYRLEAPRFLDPEGDAPPIPFLHEIDVSLAVSQRFGDRWSLLVKAEAGLAGDLAAVDRGTVRVAGVALGAYRFSEAFELGAGLGVTWAFGQVLPIPVVKLRWEPDETLSLEGLLPSHLTFAWQPVDRFRTGLFGEILGNEYAIRTLEAQEFAECTGEERGCLDHVAYTDGNVGGFVGARVVGGLWLEAHGGASVYRRFEMLDVNDEPVVNGDQRLPPAGFGKLRLGLAAGAACRPRCGWSRRRRRARTPRARRSPRRGR